MRLRLTSCEDTVHSVHGARKVGVLGSWASEVTDQSCVDQQLQERVLVGSSVLLQESSGVLVAARSQSLHTRRTISVWKSYQMLIWADAPAARSGSARVEKCMLLCRGSD